MQLKAAHNNHATTQSAPGSVLSVLYPARGDVWRGEHARFRRCLFERDLRHKGLLFQWWIAYHDTFHNLKKKKATDLQNASLSQRSSCWLTRWTFSRREVRRLQPLLPGRWDWQTKTNKQKEINKTTTLTFFHFYAHVLLELWEEYSFAWYVALFQVNYMLLHPDVQAKVQEEVDQVLWGSVNFCCLSNGILLDLITFEWHLQ